MINMIKELYESKEFSEAVEFYFFRFPASRRFYREVDEMKHDVIEHLMEDGVVDKMFGASGEVIPALIRRVVKNWTLMKSVQVGCGRFERAESDFARDGGRGGMNWEPSRNDNDAVVSEVVYEDIISKLSGRGTGRSAEVAGRRFSDSDRDVVDLNVRYDLRPAEISRALGVPPWKVRVVLDRARVRLLDVVKED